MARDSLSVDESALDSLSVDESARDPLSVDELTRARKTFRPFKDKCGSRGPHARKLELFSLEPARARRGS